MSATCCMCDKSSTSLHCSKCKAASYCSNICQKKHWKFQHKKQCRPCLTEPLLLSHIFDGRSKEDILEYANTRKDIKRYQEDGYLSLLGVALALQVSTKELMSGLMSAHGDVSEDNCWVRHWTPAERDALRVGEGSVNPCVALCGRLSPGFTAIIRHPEEEEEGEGGGESGELIRLPLRMFSTLDEFGRLRLLYTYSNHEGTDVLKYFSQRHYGEDDASFLTLTRTCVDNDIFYGTATESLHDALERQKCLPTQAAFTPGYEEVWEAAVAAQLIVPVESVDERRRIFEVCDIESWTLLP